MQTLIDSVRHAIWLIVTLDPAVLQYAVRSLWIALTATLVASVVGVPLAILIAEGRFVGRRALVMALNTLMALPTVVVGLLVYMLLSHNGPLGAWQLLFTVPGILVGEVVLILPIVMALSVSAVSRTDRDVRKTALALGASGPQVLLAVLREARFGLVAALIAAFGRVISEVGVSMIVGGNIDHFTRTMTTSIVVALDMGNLATAMALGLVLMVISLLVNVLLQLLQGSGQT